MSTQRYSFTPHPIETILTGQDDRDRHPGDPAALRLGLDQGSELSRSLSGIDWGWVATEVGEEPDGT